ncbi:MAG TPA: uroporphyrinogen decarboxylase family protein [Sedimentisphaerales bacterium]|nr:uroporphyrinogen decarboxylase family protein [Sedimentisphaerales bacterium]
MSPKERVRLTLEGKRRDRPPFCPAIYEHKARLLGRSPSEVSRSAGLLEQAVLAEYETYGPDMLTVGIDIYDVEAEALGSEVWFPEAVDAVPIIKERILSSLDDFGRLGIVDVASSGRMPLVLEAAKAVNDRLGREVFVRGAISAPYSMAVELMGIEELLIGMIERPDEVNEFLSFLTEVSISYGKAFINRGVGVCVFDSYAAPPLISPRLFKAMILPHVRKLIAALKECGAEFVEYVIGGRTEPIAEHLFATGADILLCDFAADVNIFLELTKETCVLVRRNVSPVLIEQGPDEELDRQINSVRRLAAEHCKVIIGTGAISYNTSAERVLMVKKMCLKESGET